MQTKPSVACDIFGRFSNLGKCRREAAGDLISGTDLYCVGMDVHASIRDYRLNSGRIIQLVPPDRFEHVCALFSNIL